MTTLLRGKDAERALSPPAAGARRSVHFDNEHSQKYTVLEIVADDALGLLHRISRGPSRGTDAISTSR